MSSQQRGEERTDLIDAAGGRHAVTPPSHLSRLPSGRLLGQLPTIRSFDTIPVGLGRLGCSAR